MLIEICKHLLVFVESRYQPDFLRLSSPDLETTPSSFAPADSSVFRLNSSRTVSCCDVSSAFYRTVRRKCLIASLGFERRKTESRKFVLDI